MFTTINNVAANEIPKKWLKGFNKKEAQFKIIIFDQNEEHKNDDLEITASFDVTTEEGKKKCLENFKSLCR